jgi:beta-glucosidase
MRKVLLFVASLLYIGTAQAQLIEYRDETDINSAHYLDNLLSKMTLEEKVGQLRCTLAWNYCERKGNDVVLTPLFEKEVLQEGVGNLWATFRADPWTQRSLDNGLGPKLSARAANKMQRVVREKTRLGIPLFFAEEAPHGHMAIGSTVFPTGFGMAATWDAPLMHRVGDAIRRQVRSYGAQISYGPVMDLSRDPRWSRVEESFGEDPVLTATMASAEVAGLSTWHSPEDPGTIATLKHFIGYGTTWGGQNGGPSAITERDMLQNFLPPFKQAIDSGALSIMTSYNSLDGVPSTGSHELLTDILRNSWKFHGIVVSDLYSIDVMYSQHHVAASLEDAAIMALKAGVDMDLGGLAYATLPHAVRSGRIPEALVDSAVIHVLRAKYDMGLFHNRYVDEKKAEKLVNTPADVALVRQVAQESITLLENRNNTLPLSKKMRVALVGPNADNVYNMLGDYTAPQPEGRVKTVLDGFRAKLPASQIEYVKGCSVRDTTQQNIAEAVEAAKRSDVVVVVAGGSSARDFKTNYKSTGAAETDANTVSDMDSGEGFDRASLSLLGLQEQLLKALKATGKPLVVVYIEGRPLDKNWAAANADALLTAYYPGQEGGNAIADVLFGDVNPSGRLPISVPRSVGQLPVYYNHVLPEPHDYVEMTARPLYAFGYGKSYTTFDYSNLRVAAVSKDSVTVSFDVTNTGSRDGAEVVQLYLNDSVASVAQPVKQLRRFARVPLAKGETKHVVFTLHASDLSIINAQKQWAVEPGWFNVMVGAASDDIRLRDKFEIF